MHSRISLVLVTALVLSAGITPALAQVTPRPADPPATVVGRWQSPDSEVQINADGTLTINGTMYRYSIAGKIFTLIGTDGVLPMPFELNGDRLSVTINGQVVPMQRIVAGKAAAGSDGRGGGAGDAASSELAGKWCFLANFTANTGGRMSNECVTFSANGTYQYFAETSSSGANGSTASQQSDTGTWAISGSSLVVNSRSQGRITYALVKRNHPKNNDPMICLDGRCFVTYGPKPPWR